MNVRKSWTLYYIFIATREAHLILSKRQIVIQQSFCSCFLCNFLCKGCKNCRRFVTIKVKLSAVFVRTSTHPRHVTLVTKTAESLAFLSVITVLSKSHSGFTQKKTAVFLKMPAPAHGYNSQLETFSKCRQEIKNFPNNTPDSTGGWFPACEAEPDWRSTITARYSGKKLLRLL